ncbi:MAG: FapA family protein [Planctomycetota bacterium]
MPSPGLLELAVNVSRDQMMATLQIPSGYPAHMLTPDVCVAQFEANGVVIGRDGLPRIDAAVSAYRKTPSQAIQVELTGTPPVKGANGYLELAEACRPLQPAAKDQTPDHPDEDQASPSVDHYARNPFVLAKRGQVIAHVIPPGDGEDGQDVTGASIPAHPGKPFPLKPHDSIIIDAYGRVIAQVDGTLEHSDTNLRVNSVLRINGQVDFETGHIDFDGDVEIAKGVCDNFKVHVKRNAVIQGVVEAAELRIGRDLTLITGMFAKDKGTLHAGRACHAKFLQQTKAETVGDLTVDKEIVNCDLVISGAVRSPNASLIGGTCHAVGEVILKHLGSETGTPTLLHLGSSPQYDRLMDTATQKLEGLAEKAQSLQKQIDMIHAGGSRIAAQHKEDITELWCVQMSAQEEHDKLKRLIESLTERYRAARSARVTVLHTIHPESKVILGGTAAEFVKPIRGPITIMSDPCGEIAFRRAASDPLQPMRSIARLAHWS